MTEEVLKQVQDAVAAWARDHFQAEVTTGVPYEDEDEPGRYIVAFTMPGDEAWQAAEVWLEDGEVVAVNWLGEGLSPEEG